MLNATFRPLDKWPGERTRSRQRARFKVTYARSLDLLESELQKLRAKNLVIQVDGLTLQDIRNDGWPRSSWTPGRNSNTGVIVSFQSGKGAMSFPCDRFDSWQYNLRAIALSLEALRTVDRYGVTRGNEQYRGWARLEAPPNGNGMTRQGAIEFMAKLHGSNPENMARMNVEQWRDVCRTAKIENHPDRGGKHETFVTIGQAESVLCGGI